MSHRFLAVVFVAVSACLGLSENGLATDFHSPRTAGLGGAGHASPILTDAIYMNPAMMPFLPAYSISVSHNGYNGPNDSEPKGRVQNLSIQDGTNPLFQAGVGYTRKAYGSMVNVGAATRVLEKYGVGVGGKFLFGSTSKASAQDFIVSAMGGVTDWLQASLTVDNAIHSSKSKVWNPNREITLGLKANIEKMFLVYIDPHFLPSASGSTTGYEMGAEIPVMSDLYLRGGFNHNALQPHLGAYGKGYGFGFGWNFPRMSLDAALSRTKEPRETNNFLFSITII